MNKRRRTLFPCHINFSGWYVKGAQGNVIGQLERVGRDLYANHIYNIVYHDVVGNGVYTTEDLMETGVTITLDKPEIGNAQKPPIVQRRIIMRR
jgi:hypothetical protein